MYKDLTPEEKAIRVARNKAWRNKNSEVKSRLNACNKKYRDKKTPAYLDSKKRSDLKWYAELKKDRPWYLLWQAAKARAKRKNVPFDITPDDVEALWSDTCPILGIKMESVVGEMNHHSSASLDRIIPEKGYVKGNIIVISFRANTIKSCGTLEEHRKIVSFLEKQHTLQETSNQDPDCQQS